MISILLSLSTWALFICVPEKAETCKRLLEYKIRVHWSNLTNEREKERERERELKMNNRTHLLQNMEVVQMVGLKEGDWRCPLWTTLDTIQN